MRLLTRLPPGDDSGVRRRRGFEMGLIRDFFGEDESGTDMASAGNGESPPRVRTVARSPSAM